MLAEATTRDEWAQLQSDDAIQSENYCGGYWDGEDFHFWWWDDDENQSSFELRLEDIPMIVAGEITAIEMESWPPGENVSVND